MLCILYLADRPRCRLSWLYLCVMMRNTIQNHIILYNIMKCDHMNPCLKGTVSGRPRCHQWIRLVAQCRSDRFSAPDASSRPWFYFLWGMMSLWGTCHVFDDIRSLQSYCLIDFWSKSTCSNSSECCMLLIYSGVFPHGAPCIKRKECGKIRSNKYMISYNVLYQTIV